MFNEFKTFIARGNVIDLAVGVIMGAAFTAIVNSLVGDILMPLIGILMGGINFTGLSITVEGAVIAYGNFMQAVVDFLLISLVVFLVMRTINRMQPLKPAGPPDDIRLLTEIRDLLKQQGEKTEALQK